MPVTRTRAPRAASETRSTTASAIPKRKNLSQTRTTKAVQNKAETPGSEAPVTKGRGRQARPAARAPAKAKVAAGAKAVAARMTKPVENGASRSLADETYVCDKEAELSFEENKPVAKAAAKTKNVAISDIVMTKMFGENDLNFSAGNCDGFSEHVVEPPFSDQSEISPQKVAKSESSDNESGEDEENETSSTPAQTPVSRYVKPVVRIPTATKPQYPNLDVELESAPKKGKKNQPVSSADVETNEVPSDEVSSQGEEDEETEPSPEPVAKGRKGKTVATKKVEVKKVPSKPVSDDNASETVNRPTKRGGRKKNTPAENSEPTGGTSDDNAPKVANKSTRRGANKKVAPAEPAEEASDDDNDDAKVVAKPTRGGARKKNPPAETNEPMEEASDDDDDAKVVAKPTRGGARKKNVPVETNKPMEEASDDDDDAKVVTKPTRGGARKKKAPAETNEPMEEPSDDDDTDIVPKPTKRGAKKPARKAPAKKTTTASVENLPALMDQMNLNDDDTSTTKGRKKKATAGAKPKAPAKNSRKKKEVESEPEPEPNMMRYSSTESLQNVTVVRGTRGLRQRSFSAGNLDALSAAILDRPRRGAMQKQYNHESSGEEEEEVPVVKKTRAPRRKAAK